MRGASQPTPIWEFECSQMSVIEPSRLPPP